jgi:hypothetical protein
MLWISQTNQHPFFNSETSSTTHSVDLPAPLAPISPNLESSETSMFTPASNGLSLVYPKATSESCRRGGEIFSVSINLKVTTSSSSGGVSSGSFSRILILD